MIGLIIKENGKVVDKNLLDGNDEKNFMNIVELQKSNKDKEYILYNDSEIETFNSVEIEKNKSNDQVEWDKLKDKATPTEKLFAKVLGLDA